jgi:hypothetical protein
MKKEDLRNGLVQRAVAALNAGDGAAWLAPFNELKGLSGSTSDES